MEYTLSMTFINTTGDKVSISVSDVKSNLTKDEAVSLMNTIIANDIFVSDGGSLVSKYGAQLTQRNATKFDI
ncbi:DUF2922 domain-containing protein [Clostridium oryzae]|uniref:DUF2922 domain-containing protein n=1 Tax=Clostridium oryzae TaxID=1450648 RepID=A0A1V4IYN4_9CLOT|nr:DUF2922 domain-containing protein [Clostridium oryzae]OPJ64895.1 hypothetical protein CLORY_04040 [Clostridium oryzae]